MKRRALITSVALVLSAAVRAPYSSAVQVAPDPPVFLHYSFDGHYNDDSGNNNHGILIDTFGFGGRTSFVSTPAAFGQAWNDPWPLDSMDRVALTVPFMPTASQPWTVAFWHDMEGGVSMPLFSSTDRNNWFRVRADSQNRAELRIAGQSVIVWDTFLQVAQNGLFHYAIVADPFGIPGVDVDGVPGNDHVALYVNGVLIRPDAGMNLTTYATNVFMNNIGDGSNTDVGPMVPFETGHGVSDELWIFQGALTAAQVNNLRTRNTIEPDTDGDGVSDGSDNCPTTANRDQADADVDGRGDACDVCPLDPADDIDADGLCANVDNCPLAANADQTDADADGQGDVCDPDDDNDAAPDTTDNCPRAANADQADADADGAGDVCDPDDDNDGMPDATDSCPASAPGSIVNASGCSIADMCSCNAARNHGQYVSCVSGVTKQFEDAGLITQPQRKTILNLAAQAVCGE